MQLIIPISNSSKFFPEEEFYFPKPLVEVLGMPMIQLVIDRVKSQFEDLKFYFVLGNELEKDFSISSILKMICINHPHEISYKQNETRGALASCLLTIDNINMNDELIVLNSDQLLEHEFSDYVEDFKKFKCDAGLLSFKSVHPRWSYIKKKEKTNEVIQVFEKKVVSDDALLGFSYYKQAKVFFQASIESIKQNDNTNGEFFISGALNQILLDGGKILVTSVKYDQNPCFYSPNQISAFEKLNRTSTKS
jgi:NDP-sugar pyrophosphorylase family protein